MGDPTNQVHDFEPGIKPSGLFWTIPVPPTVASIDSTSGSGRYRIQNLAIPDFHDFFNAISPFPSTIPGHVSFDVRGFERRNSATTEQHHRLALGLRCADHNRVRIEKVLERERNRVPCIA